jgi:hypothetical protein
MISYYVWFTILACFVYLIATDQSIIKFVQLLYKITEIQYTKVVWWIKNNPRNPIVRFQIERRSMKLAKELMKEIQEKKCISTE